MLLHVYAILDRKLREFGPLIVSKNDETVQRELQQAVHSSGSMMEKYPEDFDLNLVGSWDSEIGAVSGCIPVLVGSVASILAIGGPGGPGTADGQAAKR